MNYRTQNPKGVAFSMTGIMYKWPVRGMSVYRASKEYIVPESTLRDKTRGNVSLDTKVGVETLFTECEEQQIVDHVK